ncbi:MAG: hypothetical protein HRU20_14250 [Pseudomonadales bacterium]|nr:hypothetical protein [Pseudomonadales bacterium]
MKKSIKAFIFSAFIFPGSGYFCVKRPVRAAIAIALVFAAFWVIINFIMQLAGPITDQVVAGTLAADPVLIRAKIEQQLAQSNNRSFTFSAWLIACIWVFTAVDGFRLGKQLDRQQSSSN